MVLLEQAAGSGPTGVLVELDERAARRTLRAQIARLDRDLGAAVLAAYPRLPVSAPASTHAGPHVLSLGELERVRDELAGRLADVGALTAAQAERQAEKRLLLERMLAGWWHVKISSGCPLGACRRSRHARMRPSTLRRIGRRTLANTSVLTSGPSTPRLD